MSRSQLTAGGQFALLWVAICCALAGSSVPAGAQETAPVDSIAFVGLARVDPDLVSESVRVEIGQPAYPFRLSQSVRSLFQLGLFDQISAYLKPNPPGGLILEFHFVERPRVTQVSFSGHEFFSAEDLKGHAGLVKGQVYDEAEVQASRRAMKTAYLDEGFAQADIRAEATPDPGEEGVRVRFVIDEGQRVKITGIHFLGNAAFSGDELRGKVSVKKKGFLRKGRFNREQLDVDVAGLVSFYRNQGYKDAKAQLRDPLFSADGQEVQITFEIEEGPQYRFGPVAWDGVSVLDSVQVKEALFFKAGDPYDQSKVDETLAALYDRYTERGYLVELRIEPLTRVRGDEVGVTFMVHEGDPSRVGEIKIVGNTRTKEHVVRREMKLYPGDLLRRSALLRSQRDIFATGYFEDVQIEFNPAAESGEVNVTFRVLEKSSAQFNAGAGYSSQIGLTGFVKIGHNNLFGNGQALSMEVERGSRREYYDLSFTEPWVLGRPISAGVDLYNTETYRRVYAGTGLDASYWHRLRGGGVRVGFPWFLDWPDYTRMTVGYSLSDTRYRDYNSLPEDTQRLLIQGEGTLSRLFMSWYRNSTDNPFHPSMGARTTLRTEFNGGLLGGSMDFYEFSLDHRQYLIPFWKPVLMIRGRFGMLGTYERQGSMPPAERYRMGGITGFNLLRGYDDYYIVPEENIKTYSDGREYRFPGGNYLLAFTAEFQFPVVAPLYGALFFDAGDTWNSGYDMSLSGLKLGAGVGITMEVPMLGPIGLYYAYGFERKRWKTHFAFGPQF